MDICVSCLFLVVLFVGLESVIIAFPSHTHFLLFGCGFVMWCFGSTKLGNHFTDVEGAICFEYCILVL